MRVISGTPSLPPEYRNVHMLLYTFADGNQVYSMQTFSSVRYAFEMQKCLLSCGVRSEVIYGPAIVAGTRRLPKEQGQGELHTAAQDKSVGGGEAAAGAFAADAFVAEKDDLVGGTEFGQKSSTEACGRIFGYKYTLSWR